MRYRKNRNPVDICEYLDVTECSVNNAAVLGRKSEPAAKVMKVEGNEAEEDVMNMSYQEQLEMAVQESLKSLPVSDDLTPSRRKRSSSHLENHKPRHFEYRLNAIVSHKSESDSVENGHYVADVYKLVFSFANFHDYLGFIFQLQSKDLVSLQRLMRFPSGYGRSDSR